MRFSAADITRDGKDVRISLICKDDYEVILVFDRLQKHLRDGFVIVSMRIEVGSAKIRCSDNG